MNRTPPASLFTLRLRHKAFAQGIAEGENFQSLTSRLNLSPEVAERLLRSSAFQALVEALRAASGPSSPSE